MERYAVVSARLGLIASLFPRQWPGYAPWSRQIPTRDFRSPPGPITRSKLAKNVAKTIQRFIDVSPIPCGY